MVVKLKQRQDSSDQGGDLGPISGKRKEQGVNYQSHKKTTKLIKISYSNGEFYQLIEDLTVILDVGQCLMQFYTVYPK